MANPITAEERESIIAYIRDHKVLVSDKGDVTMNGCYLTKAIHESFVMSEFSDDSQKDAIPVGPGPDGSTFYLLKGMYGVFRILAKYSIDEVYSYSHFDKQTTSRVACIGISNKLMGWLGWTHRGSFFYKLGHVVKEDDYVTISGWLPSYEREHPERCFNVSPGFVCNTMDDCKRCAIAHAEALS